VICSGCGCAVVVCADAWGLVICRRCADEGRDLVDELIEEVRTIELLAMARAADLLDEPTDEASG